MPTETIRPKPERMTGRERILAALRRQPVDRLPFVPLIDNYTVLDMPPEIVPPDQRNNPRGLLTAARNLGCDIMLRHVPIAARPRSTAPHLQSLGAFGPPVNVKTEFQDGHLCEIIETPVGALTGRWKFTDRVGWIPHSVRHAVLNFEELKIFDYAVDHLIEDWAPPDPEAFRTIENELGESGLATASISNSPFMFFIEMAVGLEQTYYLLQDHPAEVEAVLDKLHASLKRYVRVAAESPAEVVIQYENTSSTLLSPAMFRRYCLPYLNEYADILRDAGKIFLIHMCGTLFRLVDDIAAGHFHGIADITPQPTGDLPLDVAAQRLPGMVVVGGIDPNTFINPDPAAVEAEVSGLIERIKPYPGVLLGSADTTPRGTPPENFRLIQRLVETVGVYE